MTDKPKPKLRTTVLIKSLPLDLHLSFKSTCAKNGKTMRRVLEELMREYVKRNNTTQF